MAALNKWTRGSDDEQDGATAIKMERRRSRWSDGDQDGAAAMSKMEQRAADEMRLGEEE